MTGQYIRLDGVTIPSGYNPPRVIMTDADIIAASMPTLEYAVSPDELNATAVGFDRAVGAPLERFGNGAQNLAVADIAGYPAITLVGGSNVSAALSIDEGNVKVRNELAVVYAAYTVAVEALNTNLISTHPGYPIGGGTQNTLTRITYVNESTVNVGVSAIRASMRPVATGQWHVICISLNDTTGKISVDGEPFVNFATTALSLFGESWGYEFGKRDATFGLRNASVGKSYFFNQDLASIGAGESRLHELVEALKSEYGIS